MPELHFSIEWPDGGTTRCYSPSTILRSYFAAGETMTIDQLVATAARALQHAGDRVEAKFGYRCSSAEAQLDAILVHAAKFEPHQELRIVDIEAKEGTR